MDKYVITGGAGFLGFHLVKKLSELNRVLSIDSSVLDYEARLLDQLKLDISERFPDIPAYEGATFIHTAALMNTPNTDRFWAVNVNGTRNALEWSVKHRAKHFIFLSTGGVYGYDQDKYMKETDPTDPIGFYGYTKWIGEKLCLMYHRLHDLPITVFRLYFPYGVGQQSGIVPLIVNSVREGKTLTIKKRGSPKINPIHMDDCVAAIQAAAGKLGGYRIYNLCGDETVSFLDLVHLVEEACQRAASLVHSDEDPGDLLGDNSLVKGDFNWQPRKQLTEISRIIRGGI